MTRPVGAPALAGLAAFLPLSMDAYVPALPGIAAEFGAGPAALQWTMSGALAGIALGQLLYGPVADRFGRRAALTGGILVFIAASIAATRSAQVEALVALRVLQALGGAAGVALFRAIVRDQHDRRGSARVLGAVGAWMGVVPLFAPIVGNALAVNLGWRAVFWFFAAYGTAMLIVVRRLPETLASLDRSAFGVFDVWRAGRDFIRDGRYLGYVGCCAFGFAGLFQFISASARILVEHLGAAQDLFGVLFAVVVAGFIAGSLLGMAANRVWSTDRLLGVGCVVMLMGAIALWTVARASSPTTTAVIVSMAGYNVGWGIVQPQALAGALSRFPRRIGRASAMLGFVQMSVAAIGALHLTRSLPDVLHSVSLGVLAAAVLALLSFWLSRRRPIAAQGVGTSDRR